MCSFALFLPACRDSPNRRHFQPCVLWHYHGYDSTDGKSVLHAGAFMSCLPLSSKPSHNCLLDFLYAARNGVASWLLDEHYTTTGNNYRVYLLSSYNISNLVTNLSITWESLSRTIRNACRSAKRVCKLMFVRTRYWTHRRNVSLHCKQIVVIFWYCYAGPFSPKLELLIIFTFTFFTLALRQ